MEPVTERNWRDRFTPAHAATVALLARHFDFSSAAARVLSLRNIDSVEAAEVFLDGRLSLLPDPFKMRGMSEAVERLLQAIAGGERIAIHGDYDVDGITATALLVEFLTGLGVGVDYHIPLRMKDGYGLSADAIAAAAEAGAKVIVSVDCGVSAVAEAQQAAELGIDLIITDHHQPPDPLPQAYAIVNPHQPGCDFSDKELSGVGVAFFLLVALRSRLRQESFFSAAISEPDLRYALDLVALGTIADVVPLKGLNRLLTRVGLQVMAAQRRSGLAALQKVAKVDEIDCGAVGFKLAPRLNAAGRIEDAALGVRLLLTENAAEGREIAEQLDCFNLERQAIEKATLQAALERVAELPESRRAIVLGTDDWHSGVIGIVASRLVERYYRPTVLFAFDGQTGKGSARSTRETDLYGSLQKCSELLLAFGGHAAAAGMSIDLARFDAFVEGFDQAVAADRPNPEVPSIDYDGDILIEEIDDRLVRELERLAPFGMGNPGPVFRVCDGETMGVQVVGDNHLRFSLRQGGYSLPCIAFGMAERRHELSGLVDCLVTPGFNTFRGRTSLQLRIRDWKVANEAD